MVEMIWKEPPPAVSSEKAAILAELKKNPGRWALVQTRYKSTSGTAPWKKLGCEATHRRAETTEGKSTEYDIYARWPGGASAAVKTESKADVSKAIATGTALKPPAPPLPRARAASVPPANDMGLSKFLADRRARGAVDLPE
jgi:hypothetical protein